MQSLQTLYHEKIYKTWKARIHKKESGIVDKSRNKLSICEDMKKLAQKVSSKMKREECKNTSGCKCGRK